MSADGARRDHLAGFVNQNLHRHGARSVRGPGYRRIGGLGQTDGFTIEDPAADRSRRPLRWRRGCSGVAFGGGGGVGFAVPVVCSGVLPVGVLPEVSIAGVGKVVPTGFTVLLTVPSVLWSVVEGVPPGGGLFSGWPFFCAT